MHRRHNGLKTAVLLGGLSALILVVGSFFGRTGLIVALGQWAGKDARPAFLRYMRDASLQRKWTMCQVLRETNAEWAIELLSPLLTLTDKLAEDRRGFPVFPNKAEPHLAIRLCDDSRLP